MIINHFRFFTEYRKQFGSIKKTDKVNNIITMLVSLQTYSYLFNSAVFCEQFAYLAATVMHETADTFAAFKEVRQVATDTDRRKRVRALQDRYWGTGYYGRGPVQLTWQRNYAWAENVTGRPLLNEPDLLLTDLPLGYEVIVKGMCSGAYTGKSLNHYINARGVDYINARRIVNGTDKAKEIAALAAKFFCVFTASVGV